MNKIEQLNKSIEIMKKNGEIQTKDISDTYHTIGELYEHRMVMSALILKLLKDKEGYTVFKSWKHDEEGGEMFDGMFIVGMNTPFGQISYHYNAEHWELFDVPEYDRAPKWDGHNSYDVLNRFKQIIIKGE